MATLCRSIPEGSDVYPLTALGSEEDEALKCGEQQALGKARVATITAALCMGAFLISMDRTIITIAISAITDHFHSSADIEWYASAYLITSCAFLPLFGKAYSLFDLKWTYLSCVIVFSSGSALCGFAPTSLALILGRAVAGLGSAGMFSGTLIIGARIVEPSRRTLIMALGGLTMSLASIVGPLIGGVFTSRLSWRWCFLVNLPVGTLTFLAILLALKLPRPGRQLPARSWTAKLRSFDFIGAALLLASAVMLFLALHYAAVGTPWSSSKIVLLLVFSGLMLGMLILRLKLAGDRAIVPLRLVRSRAVASAGVMAVGLYGGLVVLVYYLPVYFEASIDMKAKESGVALLPYLLATALTGIGVAVLTTRTCLPQKTAIAIFAVFGCGGSCASSRALDHDRR